MPHLELKRSPHALTLSTVVCTYDRYDLLETSVEALLRQSISTFEIVIVDNSPDQVRAQKHAARYVDHENVVYILEPRPGLSRARNAGIAASRGSVVAFIDDDAIPDTDWAKEVVKTFEEFPGKVGVVGGPASPRWVTPRPDWLTDKLLSYLSIVDWGSELRELRPEEWLAGCNIAFRRTMLDAVGGFSEALGRTGAAALLSNEETQVVDLIRADGGLVVYNPRVRVEHIINANRLDELWFYRRAAWQAVSDFLSDAEKSRAHAHKVIGRLGHVSTGRPPTGTQDRVATVYNIVLACLAGEAVFGADKLGGREGSRLIGNLKSLPRKAIEKVKRSVSR